MIKVALICNADGESYSMTHYAESLKDHLASGSIYMEEIKPHYTGKSRVGKLFIKYFFYPFYLRRKVDDYSVIHIVDHSYGYLLRYFTHSQRRRTLITCHDLIPMIDKDNLIDRAKFAGISYYLWNLSVRSIKLSSCILADSESTKKDCMRLLQLSKNKIFVVPLLLKKEFRDLLDSKQELRKNLKLQENHFYIVIIGSNLKRKNVLTSLKVLNRLLNVNDQVRLIRIGEDFDRNQKEFISKNSLEKFILFKGRLNNRSLLQYFKASDVLLFNSLYEGYGLPILEAFVLEVPVVTSNVTSMPEVAGDGAILVNPESIDETCEALDTIRKSESLRKNLIRSGRDRLKEIKAEHDRVTDLYKELAKVY